MDTSVFTDIKRTGPGIWFSMHLDAIIATTDPLKLAFERKVNHLCDNFKCKTCQPHFRKFIDTHPFSKYRNIKDSKGRDIGYFKWTWECHNQVNRFLGKPQPSLEEAYDYYSNSDAGVCFDCGSKTKEEPMPELVSRAIPPILTKYMETGEIKPKPFRLISSNK